MHGKLIPSWGSHNTVFVNDVLVETETKEGHDKIVEEILKRLEENNLYVKPEKYI